MNRMTGLLFVFVMCCWGSVVLAQEAPVQLLIVDETKTFTESIQVNALVGLLRQGGLFEITARLVDVKTGLDLPLQRGELNQRFDLVVIVPLDLGQQHTIWMFGRPYFRAKEAHVAQAAQVLQTVLEKVFALQRTTVKGIEVDVFPALVAGVFLNYGWL